MKKKIAVISATFPPYKGGMGNVAYHISDELYKRGYTISVFTPKYVETLPKSEIPFTVRYLRPWLQYGNAGFVPQLFFYLLRFQTIHLHYPFFGGAESVLLKKIIFPKTKLLLHYHYDTLGKGTSKFFFTVYRKLLLRLYFKFSDAIIYTTKDYMEHSHTYSLAKKYDKKVVCIPIGVTYTHFSLPRDTHELRRTLSIAQDAFIGLFVGTLDAAHYFKGLSVLFEAVAKAQTKFRNAFSLIIVGSGQLLPYYHSMAASYEIEPLVHFVGTVSDTELPTYYQLANVTILPSTDSSEAFGLVLIESMSSGTPVIASRLPGVRDVVGEGMGFLIEPNSVRDLTRTLLYCNDRSGWLKGRTNAIQAYAKQFDWSPITDKLEKIIVDGR